MIRRRRVPVSRGYDIGVTTERMKDGKWAVVATVTHSTRTARQTFDLPVPKARFGSEPDAETYGVRMAQRWIEQNTPKHQPGDQTRAGTRGGPRRPVGRRAKARRPKRVR